MGLGLTFSVGSVSFAYIEALILEADIRTDTGGWEQKRVGVVNFKGEASDGGSHLESNQGEWQNPRHPVLIA